MTFTMGLIFPARRLMSAAVPQTGALRVWSDCSFCKWQLGPLLPRVLFKLTPSWSLDNGAARRYRDTE